MSYKKRSDVQSLLIVSAHFALALAPVYIAVLIGPTWLWIVLWVCSGVLMNGMLNLLHECAHYLVFSGRKGSDFLGHWVLGPLLVADFDGYRWRHWEHHTHLGIAGDTKDAYLVSIQGLNLMRFLFRCLTLVEAFRKFRLQTVTHQGRGQERCNPLVWLSRTVIFHCLILASLLVAAGPAAGRSWPETFVSAFAAYTFIYLYGLVSWTVFAATLRAIAEHQLGIGQQSSTGRAALRNFRCGPVSRLIFGAYGFAEHATHHRQPSLPYYHLAKVTDELAIDDATYIPKRGYWGELIALVKSTSPT